MEKIKINLELFQIKKKSVPNSEFAEAIENVIKFMGETNERYPYWCGRLKHFKKNPQEINDIIKQAKSWAINPKALFCKLIKKKVVHRVR